MSEKVYQNVTEVIVEEMYEDIKNSLGICTCEQCRGDVIAFALNQLEPRYVVSKIGKTAVQIESLNFQNSADVRGALIKGAELIRQHPRH